MEDHIEQIAFLINEDPDLVDDFQDWLYEKDPEMWFARHILDIVRENPNILPEELTMQLKPPRGSDSGRVGSILRSKQAGVVGERAIELLIAAQDAGMGVRKQR